MSIPAVILAGGVSRRMGQEKAFVDLAGRSLIHHVIGALLTQAGPLAINANGDPARFAGLHVPVLPDGGSEGWGPLAGILCAMEWAAGLGAERVLTAPVDTPFLPTDLVARLSEPDAPIALAETADGLHGTVGLWSTALRTTLRADLQSGVRKVTNWTAQNGAVAVRFPAATPPPFFNINRPEDLEQAARYIDARA